MARPGLFTHRKFLRLSKALGSRMLAVGALESVWRIAYEAGDPLVGDADLVEYACEWRGEPGALARELVAAGFLDEGPDGLLVHDLFDHAPDYVRKRKTRHEEREGQRRAPDGGRTVTGQSPDADRTVIRTPLPSPPIPTREEIPPEAPPVGGAPDAFEEFWKAYPRKAKKPTARKAWEALSGRDQGAALAGAVDYAGVWSGATDEELRVAQHPATWLRARAWEDGPAEWRRVRLGAGGPRAISPPPLVGAHPPEPGPRAAPASGEAPPPEPPGGGVWPAILERLREVVDERDFDTWFRGTRQAGEVNGSLRVVVQSKFSREYLSSGYGDVLRSACSAEGVAVPLEFIVVPGEA